MKENRSVCLIKVQHAFAKERVSEHNALPSILRPWEVTEKAFVFRLVPSSNVVFMYSTVRAARAPPLDSYVFLLSCSSGVYVNKTQTFKHSPLLTQR